MSDRLTELVRQARSDGPDPAEVARLREALGDAAAGDDWDPSGGDGTGGGGGAGGLGLGKLGVALGGVAAVGAALAVWWLAPPPPHPQPASVDAPAASSPAEHLPAVEPGPPRERRGEIVDAVAPPPPPAPDTARDQGPREAPPPPSEAQLIDRARGMVSSAPARALALCERHARLYPNAVLAQEREVVAIDALVMLGRMERAERRAERFARAYPTSIHQPRVDAILGRGGIRVTP